MFIVQKRLKEKLLYDQLTGIFTWVRTGKKAGCITSENKLSIRVDGVLYLAHRLAWLYVHGVFPESLDHEDGNGLNNSILNLRVANQSINMRNTKVRSDNSSGVMGVHLHKQTEKWRAVITTDLKLNKHLGLFIDKFEAICCRKSAENNNGYHFNHGRTV